jgi:hypothetical protein
MKPSKPNQKKVWSRKGNCPECDVQTGSRHQSSCQWTKMNKNKMKQPIKRKWQLYRVDNEWMMGRTSELDSLRVRPLSLWEKINYWVMIREWKKMRKQNEIK